MCIHTYVYRFVNYSFRTNFYGMTGSQITFFLKNLSICIALRVNFYLNITVRVIRLKVNTNGVLDAHTNKLLDYQNNSYVRLQLTKNECPRYT